MNVEIDYSVLDGIASLQRPNKPNLLETVVGLYESESPKCITQILEGISAGDADMIRMGAHSLKSSSANLGAVELSGRCRDIEYAARQDDLETCAKLSEQLVAEFDASILCISNHMKKVA